MAQIKKINIKGVEYDIAGSGSSTTDTAYVDNKTLYIEEGTTASGGSGGLKVVEITEIDYNTELLSDNPIIIPISEERMNEINNADAITFQYHENNYMYLYRDTSYYESETDMPSNEFKRFIIDLYDDGRVQKHEWAVMVMPMNPERGENTPILVLTYTNKIVR